MLEESRVIGHPLAVLQATQFAADRPLDLDLVFLRFLPQQDPCFFGELELPQWTRPSWPSTAKQGIDTNHWPVLFRP